MHRFWDSRLQKFRDLENRVRGLSRSLEITPVDRAHTTSYWRSIVTMALSRAVSEIFNVEKCHDLEIWVRGHSRSLKVAQLGRSCIVPGVSHVKKCDWLVKNMTDWRLEVDLGQLNDWRRLAVNMTGGGDLHQPCCLLLCLLCSARGPTAPITCSEYSFFVLVLKFMYYL